MYIRKEYKKKEKEFMYNIRQEYSIFKSTMLLKPPHEIYSEASSIYFYECIYEYFQFNEERNHEFVQKVCGVKNIISELMQFYNKSEHLSVNTWEGIDGIINCYMYSIKSVSYV